MRVRVWAHTYASLHKRFLFWHLHVAILQLNQHDLTSEYQQFLKQIVFLFQCRLMSPGTPLFALSDTLTDGGGAELARRLDWSCTQGATSRGRFDEGFGAIGGKPKQALCFVFFLAELVPLSSSKSARFSIVAAGTDKEFFLVFLLVVSWRAASLVAVEMSDGAETLNSLPLEIVQIRI